jgi:hypothetical protein
MIYARWRVYAQRRPWIRSQGVQIYFQMKGIGEGAPEWIMTFEEKELRESQMGQTYESLGVKPLELPDEAAQQLMDELWQCGIRPSEGTGSAGSLKATQDHLESMKDSSNRFLAMLERAWDWQFRSRET